MTSDGSGLLLGAIADDLTGATDLAGSLARVGMRVTIRAGVPSATPDDADDGAEAPHAVVVALKSRSIEAAAAVDQSLGALEWLRDAGAARIYFKYASTFDSTPAGNIGPVTEALQDTLGATITAACPAFPANGRTVVDGQLLVDGVPLAESPMRHHPLNPMTESDLVRVLAVQARGRVGLVPGAVVAGGPSAIRGTLDRLAAEHVRHAIVDAAEEADLAAIASAVADDVLVTGGSALAAAIAGELVRRGELEPTDRSTEAGARRPSGADGGPTVVLAGSCSAATLRQLAAVAGRWPTMTLDPLASVDQDGLVASVVAWAQPHLGNGPIVVRSSADAATVARVVAAIGPDAGRHVETTFGEIARALVAAGVRRLVVAGGETSGAVVEALGIRRLDVVAEIEPGVPWVRAALGPDQGAAERGEIRLVLKSGNFGSDDFFLRAVAALG